jgi:release factor glutamine methyltransferase
VSRTYRPLLEKYLTKSRVYLYRGVKISVTPGVFHPGFFTSTKMLWRQIGKLAIQGKSLLELGAGSGLISVSAAKQGARVTATDINPAAIRCLEINRLQNEVELNIIRSDLFRNIPRQSFDIIAINPPYYKKTPQSMADYAWFCGENGEYFEQLFNDLGDYIHGNSTVLMVLCDGCDLEMILTLASRHGFLCNCVLSQQNLLETNFIFKIESPHVSHFSRYQ